MSLDLVTNPIDRLRLASLLDGLSFLILLGIAMPLKYIAGYPSAVRVVGSLHGALFVALCLLLLLALIGKKLPFAGCLKVFAAAFIPFAPFFLDRYLRSFRT